MLHPGHWICTWYFDHAAAVEGGAGLREKGTGEPVTNVFYSNQMHGSLRADILRHSHISQESVKHGQVLAAVAHVVSLISPTAYSTLYWSRAEG